MRENRFSKWSAVHHALFSGLSSRLTSMSMMLTPELHKPSPPAPWSRGAAVLLIAIIGVAGGAMNGTVLIPSQK